MATDIMETAATFDARSNLDGGVTLQRLGIKELSAIFRQTTYSHLLYS